MVVDGPALAAVCMPLLAAGEMRGTHAAQALWLWGKTSAISRAGGLSDCLLVAYLCSRAHAPV